jgi:hypothetical protein
MLVLGIGGGCCSTQASVEGTSPTNEETHGGHEVAPEGVPVVPVGTVAEGSKGKDHALLERCTAQRDFAGLSFEEGQGWRQECKPAFDCTAPLPAKACCLAMTPQCMACADSGRAAKAAFDFACFGEAEAVPEAFDCASPPPLTPCCKALTPRCLDCAAKNRFVGDTYRKQCGK